MLIRKLQKNITDYVRLYGDKTFKERELNEVDSLVLSELAYLQFGGLVRFEKPQKTLIGLRKFREELVFDTLLPKSNRKLLSAAFKSARFKDIKIGYFKEYNNKQRQVRFAAVTFKLYDGLHYVAFRGTDVTLLAWKEDFNMAFSRKIPSQGLAEKYLEQVAEKIEGKLIVGGHSKGGNLAEYSAVHAKNSIRSRIIAVYNHDGPGFHDSIFTRPEYIELSTRIYKTVPHDSLIGVLLCHTEDYKVVPSRSVLIGQHNPFAWEVEGENSFAELPETTVNSKRTDKVLRDWIDEMDEPTRRKFVNAMYSVVEGSGATSVPEFKRGLFKKIRGMREAYEALPVASKVLVKMHGVKLLRIWLRNARKQMDS